MEFGRSATIRRSLARGKKALIFHTEKTMHREGYIMQEVTSYGNMSEAFDRYKFFTKSIHFFKK